ncbi:MAG: FAD-binding and (Fe-S)-binding domain-containing protein [Candidatus Zixiibacteriota bacterium]
MRHLTDKITLCAYSSDGSIYEIKPASVISITNSQDIIKAVSFAREKNYSIIPRGGGTGLVGGSLGTGIVLDFAGFGTIMAIDPANKMVHTQVGIIYEELNRVLKNYRLFFPPDPSSGDTCQIGGMIANNSSGPKSVKYGLTSEFLEELAIIDSSARLVYLKKLHLESTVITTFFAEHPEYEKVLNILESKALLIKEKWPKLKKNSAGYNLYQVVKDLEKGVFNLPALMASAEGTLAVIVSAKLRLLSIPTEKLTVRLYFKSLVDAGRSVKSILDIGPSTLEIVDGATLDLIGRVKYDIPNEVAALLLIEFDSNVNTKKEQFLDLAAGLDLAGPVDFAYDPESISALWKARKAIVPTLYRHHATKRPISLVEDVSLPPDQIPPFIEYATSLFKKHELVFGMFGHIGDGNLHLRPLFDLNNKDDFGLAMQIYDQIYDKVIELGGSTTAEHADGRLRTPLLKKLYGEEIYDVFRQIKNILDPDNIFSPGSIIGDDPFTENIDYKKLESFCAACGKCNGYCPAYEIFKREDYSPRGWLRILNQSGASRSELDKFLQFCLNCKNCSTVCPAGVSIADEILSYKAERPSAISKAVIALTDNESLFGLALKVGKLAEPLVESQAGQRILKGLGHNKFGFDTTTQLPRIAGKNLRKKYANRLGEAGEVAFFHGCADNLFESNVGEALFNLFDNLGIDLKIPKQKCCGLPHEVYGHHQNMVEKAKYNIDRLANFKTVITGCASCLHRIKEYAKIFDRQSPYYDKAVKLKNSSFDISQYLNSIEFDFSRFGFNEPTLVTYHNPCHLRADGSYKEPLKLISKLGNVTIKHPELADRCCGQAGSFGYMHYQEGKNIFARKREEYYNIGAKYIMTSCPSCRMKIQAEMGGNFQAVHPVELLNMIIEKDI